ncbi:MAG: hypothetical protein M3R47_02900 [Chloroflexota bacterium]|nr:hypothetical protein [Chloroflexota bacterium]
MDEFASGNDRDRSKLFEVKQVFIAAYNEISLSCDGGFHEMDLFLWNNEL